MKRTLSAFALMAASLAAEAEVYKCVLNDRLAYQSTPCAPGDDPTRLNPQPGEGLAQARQDAEQSYWQKVKQRRADAKADAERRAREAEQKRRAAAERAIDKGELLAGMTPDEVQRAWGEPSSVKQSEFNGKKRERWRYDNDDSGDVRTAILENGRLVRASR